MHVHYNVIYDPNFADSDCDFLPLFTCLMKLRNNSLSFEPDIMVSMSRGSL